MRSNESVQKCRLIRLVGLNAVLSGEKKMSYFAIAIILALLLAGIATAGCVFGLMASEITNELAKQVLKVSSCLWVVSMLLFFNRWYSNGGYLLVLGALLSFFFTGWCMAGLGRPDLAVIALRANAVGLITIFFLYIISPVFKGEHDSKEM